MRLISFELTMPNVGSWNGKWSGADRKYYIIKSFSKKFFKDHLEKHFNEKLFADFYYNFGDGWGANVTLQVVDSTEASRRRKISAGFCGYEWMVDSILRNGTINTDK